MTATRLRRALWHLRTSGPRGLRDFARSRHREAQPTRPADTPELSVIVPAFNAADHIARCLRSITGQAGVRLEVIVVDDGSRDDTARVVADLAEDDARITLISEPNAGPAAARNRGVSTAQGTFLAFADADDEVLPGAYAAMLDSLKRTGSDIVTGSYLRLGAHGRSRPKLTARVHARRRPGVRLEDMPDLLEEPVLWNKVYVRDFWNRHVGTMRNTANYEDQEPVYRAVVGAAAIDVLTLDVYGWRLAEGRATRSRRKGRLTDLRARLDVIAALDRVLVHASDQVRQRAYAVWMGTDLAMHAEYLGTAGKKFRKALTTAAATLRADMPEEAWDLIPAQARLLMWVVAEGRLDDIEEVLGTRAEETTAVPLEFVDGRWRVTPTYLSRLTTPVPSRLTAAHRVDFKPTLIIRNARWVGERVIELRGCAYVAGIDSDELEVRIHGVMDGATEIDIPVETMNDNRIDLEVGDPWRSYAAGGFSARIDLGVIADVSPRGIQLHGAFAARGVRLTTPATATTVVGMVAPSPVVEHARLTVVADDHDELSILPITLPSPAPLATRLDISGDTVALALDAPGPVSGVEAVSRTDVVSFDTDGTGEFHATLPELPERYRAGGERIWTLRARLTDGSAAAVHHRDVDYLLPDAGRVRLEPNVEGRVELAQRQLRVTVTGASSDRDRLLLTGRAHPPQKLDIVLRSADQTIIPAESRVHADGSFTAVYELTTTGSEGGRVAGLSGGYHVRFGPAGETADGWARVAGKLALRPVDIFTEWTTLRVEGRTSGAVALTASPPWSAGERTRFGRFALRRFDWGPVRRGILFESYNGKSANDNPRAIFEAIRAVDPDIPLYWSIRDRRVDVPEGGIPVVEGTADWHRALATSQVWVNNNNFPYYARKRPGQFYLQTWHGTPIKKLLWDLPRRKVPLTYRRLMRTEVPQWDLLLAQSEEAAGHLRTGLGYEGPIEVMEYPRNTRLGEGLAAPWRIRRRLGLGDDEIVILYVPTWRNRHRAGQELEWTEYLDPEALAIATNARVLVRSHHVAKSRGLDLPGVLDVTGEPHVEDLMAVADLLITDYSSVAYDFELTGRPIVHYTPDLGNYTRERGLYASRSEMIESAPETIDGLLAEVSRELEKLESADHAVPSLDVGTMRELVARLLGHGNEGAHR